MKSFEITNGVRQSRTKRLAHQAFRQSGLAGLPLVFEALLRRGFICEMNSARIELALGSPIEDAMALRSIPGIKVTRHEIDSPIQISVSGPSLSAEECEKISSVILAIPDNRGFTTGGFNSCYVGGGWSSYKNMKWGAKIPVTASGSGALDGGVALLVKVFPLVRVGTSFSCDGHGERPAKIEFAYDWDSGWAQAVLDWYLPSADKSLWTFSPRTLQIAPVREAAGQLQPATEGNYTDEEITGMLADIQRVSRSILDRNNIERIRVARENTLNAFGSTEPSIEAFYEEAKRQIQLLLS